MVVGVHPRDPPLLFEGLKDPGEVRGLAVHVGRRHLQIVQAHHRIDRDIHDLGAFAHNLAPYLAVGGNIDHGVGLQAGRAGEPVAVTQRATPVPETEFDGLRGRQTVHVLRDVHRGTQGYLATTTQTAAPAHRVDVHA